MKSALVSMNVQKVNIEIIPVKKRYKTRLSPETYSNPVINIIIKNQITQLNPNSWRPPSRLDMYHHEILQPDQEYA